MQKSLIFNFPFSLPHFIKSSDRRSARAEIRIIFSCRKRDYKHRNFWNSYTLARCRKIGRIISTVISAKDEQYEARADAVESFVSRSPLSKIVFLDDEGGHLYLSNSCNCDINDLDEIKETFTHWLDILRNDQSFIETMNDILNM